LILIGEPVSYSDVAKQTKQLNNNYKKSLTWMQCRLPQVTLFCLTKESDVGWVDNIISVFFTLDSQKQKSCTQPVELPEFF
jgi:hypothetical protein